MRFKKLIGKKCYLSPIDPEDSEIFTRWLNDQEVTDNLTLASLSVSLKKEREILERLAAEHNYSIIDAATDSIIGNCGFMDLDYLNRTAEIGIFIGEKSYWNKGYGSEAISLLIDYGFNKLDLHNIMLKVYAFNERAVRCYEKIGFRRIGRRRESVRRNRSVHHTLYMDILPKDFYKTNKKQD